MSSSRPGASPTNIRSAFGFPTPNTIGWRPRLQSLHRTQSPMSARMVERSSAVLGSRFWVIGSRFWAPGSEFSAREAQAESRVKPAMPSSPENFRCSAIRSRESRIGIQNQTLDDLTNRGGPWREQSFNPIDNLDSNGRFRLERQRLFP